MFPIMIFLGLGMNTPLRLEQVSAQDSECAEVAKEIRDFLCTLTEPVVDAEITEVLKV